MVLGPSGLAVVEFDTDAAGKKLLELLDGTLPTTPTVQSGSGRLHFYFRDDEHQHAARDGLELRTGNHFMVLPPSLHPNGQRYKWLLDPRAFDLEAVPTRSSSTSPRRFPGASQRLRRGRCDPDRGDRQHADVAGRDDAAPRASTREEIHAVPAPPSTRSAARPEVPDGELRESLPARSRPADSLSNQANNSFPPPIRNGVAGNNMEVASCRSALSPPGQRCPRRTAVVCPRLRRRLCGDAAAGRPKVGKSTLAFALLAATAQGESFLGLETAGRESLLLTEERRDTLAAKARILGLIFSRHTVSPKATESNLWMFMC